MEKSLNIVKFSLISLLTLINLASFHQPVSAQPRLSKRINKNKINIQFNQKQQSGADRGRPTKRRGMATRDNCPAADTPLTALIPEDDVSKAVEASPTFWFFIPKKGSKMLKGEFVLQDEQNNDVYRISFPVQKSQGIFSISLGNQKTLEKNKIYQWYFKLYCGTDADDQSEHQKSLIKPTFVRGWIQRVVLRSQQQQQLDAATSPRQRIAFYAENGIWYSALTELAKLRQTNPQNQEVLARDWSQLLRSIGLHELSNIPFSGNIAK
jgi:Domain of Unknown Function (DUF928)